MFDKHKDEKTMDIHMSVSLCEQRRAFLTRHQGFDVYINSLQTRLQNKKRRPQPVISLKRKKKKKKNRNNGRIEKITLCHSLVYITNSTSGISFAQPI